MSHKKKHEDLWKEKYEFIKELGRGGNAKVFLVKKNDSDEQFALKCLENLDKEKIIRFLDEIQIMLDNYKDIDGIMPILDYSKEQYWYVMPVAKNVLEYIKEKDINYISIAKEVIGLAETLSLLHKKGISHRDIKPANIYYYQNRFFFGDFGLVDFPDNTNDLTRSDRGIGAIFTIAPEMKRDPKHSDGMKADVFSLAKTLWMFLTRDEKGFDGTYNFHDDSMNLVSYSQYENVHLAELEEALTQATDNNPDNRMTIDEFKNKLIEWIDILDDFNKQQKSAWKFLNKYIFGDIQPDSCSWKSKSKIIEILNVLGSINAYNHMFFPDGGGLDFKRVTFANEEGCIYIYAADDICYIVKPKCLYYECFEKEFEWNYFLLELDALNPVLSDKFAKSEYLVEDYQAHYVSAQYVQYGVYDYDSEEKLPDGYKTVTRYCGGNFLFVLKIGPYNDIPATYDGRHGYCSVEDFKNYINDLIESTNVLKNMGFDQEIILNSDLFNENPFHETDSDDMEDDIINLMLIDDYVSNNYLSWCFKKLFYDEKEKGNIRFFIKFTKKVRNMESFMKCEDIILCVDGYFKKVNDCDLNQIYYVYSKERAIELLEKCENIIMDKCKDNKMICDGYKCNIDIEFERIGKPSHLFDRVEIRKLMQNADDRENNTLVIDENGYAKILQEHKYANLYPVTHETWCAGNRLVGKYSTFSTLEVDYLTCLQGWLYYLETNEHEYVDILYTEDSEKEMIGKIMQYY